MAQTSIQPRTRTQRLRGRDFYHGMITRQDVEDLLKKNGEFLLRKTENNGVSRLALSAFWGGKVRHFIIQESGSQVFFEDEGHHEEDVETLVRWHEKTKRPVTRQSGVVLRRSIPREEWVLTHESVTLDRKVGAGQFGEVYSGKLKMAHGRKLDVAVKTLREGEAVDKEGSKKFMDEARLMRQLRHDNVVRIYGVAVYEKPLMIVMELCAGGSLLKYLRERQATEEQKLQWVNETALGLQYIAKNKCIHRDVAARNCLLTDRLVLKIADFGLTMRKTQMQTDNLGKVPVKWLAKETLELGVYSLKTDVWSFGVLCWEIYSDGAEPYPGMTNAQARANILLKGYRMPIPENTPQQVSDLMQQAWETDPRRRPDFDEVIRLLQL